MKTPFILFFYNLWKNIRPYPLTVFTEDQTLYFSYLTLLSSPTMWLLIFLSIVTSLIPDFAFKLIENMNEAKKIAKLQKQQNELDNKTKTFRFLDFTFLSNLKMNSSSSHSLSILEMINLNKRMRNVDFMKKSDLSDRVKFSAIKPSTFKLQTFYNNLNSVESEPTLNSIKIIEDQV